MSATVRLLGRPAILDETGQEQPLRGLQAWALLARILLADHPVDRRRIAGELFPDAVDPLGSLRWCLAALRKALKAPDALSGDPITANLPAGSHVDVHDLSAGNVDLLAVGDLLEGTEARCSPEFATWLLVERERIAALIDEKLRQETLRALACGDHDQAVRLAERAVRRRLLDEGTHILLVKSLVASGRGDAANTHVQATEAAFERELGEPPSPALRNAALQAAPQPMTGVAQQAVIKSLIESGLAALAAGSSETGIDALRRAIAGAEACSDVGLQTKAMCELGTALVHSVRGYDDEGAVLLRRSSELARANGTMEIRTASLRELGYVEALAGRRPAAASYLDEALATTNEAESLAGIYSVVGFNLVDWGRLDSGLTHYEMAIDNAQRAGNRRRETWALGIGAWGQLAAGKLDVAERWAKQALTIVDDLKWIAFRPWPIGILAEARLLAGDRPETVRPDLEEAFALSCQLRDPCWEGLIARAMALSHMSAGEWDEVQAWLNQAWTRSLRETDAYAALLVTIRADQAEMALAIDDRKSAEAHARDLLALAARAHMDGSVNKALEVLGAAGVARNQVDADIVT